METKSIAWDSGGGYIRLTYGGSGNGTISVESDANTLGTSRSKNITVQTVGGVVTKNLTVNQAACPFPVGDVRNYSYTGSYQEVTLPAGKYKLQCWGAQGGTCSDGYSGGKGGYSEGVITLSSATTIRVYVGGQGGSTSGGFNGGGSSSGSASYSSGNTYGRSSMAGGGGATDIRLSDGALLSRMIVAGGGSGGAYTYREETTTTTDTESVEESIPSEVNLDNVIESDTVGFTDEYGSMYRMAIIDVSGYRGWNVSVTCYGAINVVFVDSYPSPGTVFQSGHWSLWWDSEGLSYITRTNTVPNNASYMTLSTYTNYYSNDPSNLVFSHEVEREITNSYSDYTSGYAGGGTNGAGYSSTYQGKQNTAGSGGSFGQGANQTTTYYRHCSGAGGGGWYGGGGGKYSDDYLDYVHYSGGGSGWVNVAASAGNRPSGYTGLQLDSGTTYAGDTSFPSTGGGTETGHSGNGYARITRLE